MGNVPTLRSVSGAERSSIQLTNGARLSCTDSTSTLYSALSRLLERGLIERVNGDPGQAPNPGLPRKAYVLSELGRRVLEAETERMQALAAIARLRLAEEGI